MKRANLILSSVRVTSVVTCVVTSMLALVATAGCGGETALDESGKALSTAALHAATTLESGSTAASLLTGIDLSRGANPEAAATAARVINDIFGFCAHATAAPAPASGVMITFAGSGCDVPFTPIELRGSLGVLLVDNGGGATLSLKFTRLQLLSLFLDGELDLHSAGDAFSYVATDLRVDLADQDLRLSGRGQLKTERLHTRVVFDGDGFLDTGATTYSFVATGVTRGIRDCYPDGGTLVVTLMDDTGHSLSMTFRFDSDTRDSGKVYLDYQGHTRDFYLPTRACTNR